MAYSNVCRDVCLDLSHFRRARFAVTLLLVVSALFVAVESNFVNVNVYGAGSLTLNPSSGPTGSDVGVSGALPIATNTCSISSPTSGLVINPSCAITGGIPGTTFNGSFTVGNVRPGQYVIQVTGGTGSNNFVQATFTVNDVAKIQLSTGPPGGFYSVGQVANGPVGTHVTVEGTNFMSTDTTCSIGVGSGSSSSFIASGSAACAVFTVRNSTGGYLSMNVTGSFVVGSVPPGQYVVQVSGNRGDFAQAVFNVTSGPFIQLFPSKGPTGTSVSIEGTNFLSTDTTCSISSPTTSSFITGAACSVFINGFGFMNVTGSFIVGNVAIGQYVVRVSGNKGDFAEAVFNVTTGPFIQLFPSKGPTGTSVNIEGSYFLSTDTTCSISSPTTSSVITGAACSVFTASSGPFLGFRNVTGSFLVGNVPAGQYVIRVSGNKGDFAEAVFNVTGGPTITLSPGSGRIGIHVVVNGTGFLLTDTTCTLSSPTTSSVLVGPACSLTLGTGRAGASFIVGNVPPGQYVIRITGSPRGDFAEAIFNVTLGPSITLNPGSGRIGGHVLVNGTGFLPGDTSCSITSPTTSSFITFAACAINAGTGTPSGSFTVGNVAPGQYVVRITGSPGSDFGSAVFNVTIGPTLTLNPGSGRIGVHVLVNGTGFLPLDSTCSISSPSTPGAVQSGTAACSIVYGSGAPQGSFTIGNVLPGQYRIRVSGNQGDFAEAVFNVTVGPTISLSPATGRPGTHVNVNGTGFLPTDGTCTISSPGSSAVTGGSQACAIQLGTGVTSGSFIIGNVLPGQYLIQVSGNQGDFAQTVLNVTSGPSVTLSPATGSIGSSINVNGTGFLPTDISCTIVSGSSNVNNPIAPSSAGCVITVGTGIVRGSFVIGFVPPGQYVIQVNGNGGDSAQAILNVLPQATTLTLYPTNATNGATVTFRATGLSTSDTGCVVLSGTYNLGVFTPNTIVLTSPTCTVPSPTIATGSFIVGPYATARQELDNPG